MHARASSPWRNGGHTASAFRQEERLMAVQLNHTIVHSRNSQAAAAFWAELLNLPGPGRFGPFLVLTTGNGVNLDFLDFLESDGELMTQHYAFLISESEFDEIFGRIRARNLPHWADPGKTQPGRTNDHDGGRGVYFEDPSGHLLEIITRPYGSGG
jgi:catechol 2,3-dioxygenase-like lactoylglutathione lyase family enzyme